MIDVLARFKLPLSFVGAIVIALVPSVYQSCTEHFSQTKMHFTYSVAPSYGAQILDANYPYKCTTDTLIDKYIDCVRTEYREKQYTVDAVVKQDKVQIPINLARRMLEEIHNTSIRLTSMPFLAKFNIINESDNSITINHVTITTDDAYSNPLWMNTASFSNNSKISIKKCSSSRNGYSISFDGEQMILPAKNRLGLIIAFSKKPFIKNSGSFVTATDIDDNKKSVNLINEIKSDNFYVKIKFVVVVFLLFLVFLGAEYLFAYIRTLRSQRNQ
ncbi:MAG: hypothetical protein JRE40_11435 [Deltaproteobacteria bacterium]|nr:hypothetical protein [Deltaproteobacteria bacterium]